MFWDISTLSVQSPSVTTKWPAISWQSSKYNFADSKNSVPVDFNSDYEGSSPPVSLPRSLSFQEHFLNITLLTQRALCPGRPSQCLCSISLPQCLCHFRPQRSLHFQYCVMSVTLLAEKSSMPRKTSTVTVHSLSPVSPLSGLPFLDHLPSMTLPLEEFWVLVDIDLSPPVSPLSGSHYKMSFQVQLYWLKKFCVLGDHMVTADIHQPDVLNEGAADHYVDLSAWG